MHNIWVYIFQIKEHAINGKKQHFPNIFLLPPTSYIMAERPPTMGKQLVNFITCSCESSAPFCKLKSRARNHAVLVIGLYELLDPATELIEPPGPLLHSCYVCGGKLHGYMVNVLDNITYAIQEQNKQWKNSFIVLVHLGFIHLTLYFPTLVHRMVNN